MTEARARAVFLDRDGVLVGSDVVDGVPTPVAEPQVLPGVLEACAELRSAGFRLVMVTNQPDIARGRISADHVALVNDRLRSALNLDDVRVCPHDDAEGCECRKPASGMLLAAAGDHNIDLSASVMVGDRWRDIQAGHNAGTRTVFVDHHYQEKQNVEADLVVSSLIEAVPVIVNEAWEERNDGNG